MERKHGMKRKGKKKRQENQVTAKKNKKEKV